MDPCTMQTLPDTLIRQITLYFHPIEYSVECGGDKKMTKVYNPIFLVNKRFFNNMVYHCTFCRFGLYLKKHRVALKCNVCGHLLFSTPVRAAPTYLGRRSKKR